MKNISVMDGYLGFNVEFLIMENGSTLIFKKLPLDSRIRYFWRSQRGLGWALREGIRKASCQQIFFLPADLSYDLGFVFQAKGYLSTGYSLVIGSKALADSEVDRPIFRHVISKSYNFVIRLRHGFDFPADITGVKAYDRRKILPLLDHTRSDGIYFEVELAKLVRNANLGIVEIPVKVNDHRTRHAFGPLA